MAKAIVHGNRFKDLTGKRFGRLKVLHEGKGKKDRTRTRITWVCRCRCGREKEVLGELLTSGGTRSCGCIRKDTGPRSATKHGYGKKRTPEYRSWMRMMGRCNGVWDEHYPDYGGRGIRICEAWQRSFLSFLADMGLKPSARHTIDRKDTNGHYSCGRCPECKANGWPANCRWATPKEQQRNRRCNRRITFNGETRCASEWAEIHGLRLDTFLDRLERRWTVKAALTTPVGQKPNPHP